MVLSEEENKILSNMIHTFIIESIQKRDYVGLKIFLYLMQKRVIKRNSNQALIRVDREQMAEACEVSPRVLLNQLKKIKSITLLCETKAESRIDHVTLFTSLTLYKEKIELSMPREYYLVLYKVLERYLHLDFASLFLLKSLDGIKMAELLESIDEVGFYVLSDFTYLFTKNYKSLNEVSKKLLYPLSLELKNSSKYIFHYEVVEELNEREEKLSLLKITVEYQTVKSRKNKKLDDFLVWIEWYKSRLIHEDSEGDRLDKNAKWQEKVTYKMDRLAHYFGF